MLSGKFGFRVGLALFDFFLNRLIYFIIGRVYNTIICFHSFIIKKQMVVGATKKQQQQLRFPFK